MFVIEVIPLRRGIRINSLTYFSGTSYEIGTILTIPVRNSECLGVVVSVEEVGVAKAALRAATFSLRKLPSQKDPHILSSSFLETAKELSSLYATPLGAMLYGLLPSEIQKGEIPLPHSYTIASREAFPPEVFQAPKNERFLAYRSLVREMFAHMCSVLIVAPTSVEADELYCELSNGIEERVIVLTGAHTKKQLKTSYEMLDDFSKSKLIIATPSHALLDRHDITIVVLEHARSPHFRERTRPYLDYRDVLRIHARVTDRRLLFADLLVRTEEELQRREDCYMTYGETPKRLQLTGKIEEVFMGSRDRNVTEFTLFSENVIDSITDTIKKKGNTFLFAARRGLAPLVACVDCGYIFRSPQSGAPYSLVRTKKKDIEERWFVCSTSGHKERAADTCAQCGSWRLKERGIGIQYVHDELTKILPDTPIILFDHMSASTYKRACYLRDTFYGTKGALMLGTSMAIPYLTEPIQTAVVVNMDAMLATPTWRLEEENFALLLSLREITKGKIYLQTRTKDTDLVQNARHASVQHFYDDELELRKIFNYPPFTTFIHFTWQGDREEVKGIETTLSSAFREYKIATYQSPTAPSHTPIGYGLIRIASSDWPLPSLVEKLQTIPSSVRVMINPDRII